MAVRLGLWGMLTLAAVVAGTIGLSLATDIGSDWLWYRDGPARVLSGAPLYDPAGTSGAFDYLALGPRWNQAPWALPIAFVFYPFGQQIWWLAMFLALVAALALAWPRLRFPWGLLLGATVALSAPIWTNIVWGNMHALVVLGYALWFVGRERGHEGLQALGIVLAGLKVVPAIPLIAWCVVRDRNPRPVAIGLAVSFVLCLPAVAYGGPSVLTDFAKTLASFAVVDSDKNLSPMRLLDPWLVRGFVIGGCVVVLARAKSAAAGVGLLAFLTALLVSNLYVQWALGPLIAALFAFRPSPLPGGHDAGDQQRIEVADPDLVDQRDGQDHHRESHEDGASPQHHQGGPGDRGDACRPPQVDAHLVGNGGERPEQYRDGWRRGERHGPERRLEPHRTVAGRQRVEQVSVDQPFAGGEIRERITGDEPTREVDGLDRNQKADGKTWDDDPQDTLGRGHA